jgi:hypothetical protein
MLCFETNKTLYDCDVTVLLNVYSYLLFVGEGWLALVPSALPHLRQLCLVECYNVCDKYVEELMAAVPELKFINCWGDISGAIRDRTEKLLLSAAPQIPMVSLASRY